MVSKGIDIMARGLSPSALLPAGLVMEEAGVEGAATVITVRSAAVQAGSVPGAAEPLAGCIAGTSERSRTCRWAAERCG